MYQAIAIQQQKITSDDVREWWIVLSKPLSKNKIYQIINQVESQPIKFN